MLMLKDSTRLGKYYMRKTFSIIDEEVLRFLSGMEKGEMSRYVTRLIKEDINRCKEDKRVLNRDDVIRLIQEYGGRTKVEKVDRKDNKVVSAAKNLINL